VVDALGRYGEHVGMAFQLVDDVLGIWGDTEVTGKPVLSDLRSRKKSLPITYVLSLRDERSEQIAQWLAGSGELDDPQLRAIADVLDSAGGRSWALAEAEREVALAVEAIESVPLAEPARAELIALTSFLIRREA
jgi:geranylgeranyl diphosphate synthase type I